MFRKVFKRDRKGNLLDARGNIVSPDDPRKFKKAVHLNDIHLESGMHCVDCHFRQDSHGDGNLYNEPRAAIEIACEDCHGTIQQKATLFTSGPAAAVATGTGGGASQVAKSTVNRTGSDAHSCARCGRRAYSTLPARHSRSKTKGRKRRRHRFEGRRHHAKLDGCARAAGGACRKRSTPLRLAARDYNEQSRYAKTMRKDNATWGDVPADSNQLAHRDDNMTCVACHSSWVTSCFGCHLSMQANRKMPNRHNEGGNTRNFTQYNFQVLRDDIFMLGRDGTVTGNRVAPVRSSSAVLVSSQNQNREWIYSQQQTTSAEGFAGQAFNTHVPHTVRSTETKTCSDCHVSEKNDNNAWMAQLLLQGTNFVNFMGRYVYVAAEHSLEVVVATEHTEPQAVFGSTLHKIAFPIKLRTVCSRWQRVEDVLRARGQSACAASAVAWRVCVCCGGRRRIACLRCGADRSERIFRADRDRAGVAVWSKVLGEDEVCDGRCRADDAGVDPARWRMKRRPMIDPAAQVTATEQLLMKNNRFIRSMLISTSWTSMKD